MFGKQFSESQSSMKNRRQRTVALCLAFFASSLAGAIGLVAAPIPEPQRADQAANQRQAAAVPSAPSQASEPSSSEPMEVTRDRFNQLLDRYPRMASVVARDPSLLGNAEYLQNNSPEVQRFLHEHPEVMRDPEFFLEGRLRRAGYGDNDRNESTFLRVYGDIGAFLVFVIITIAILWILRTLIENRRWNRLAKVQADVHTKLLERFGTSQELLAYMATEPGKRFLEASAPIPVEMEPQPRISAPIGRILWSAQVGLILALGGIGLLYVRGSVAQDDQEALLVLGTLALTFGLGFILSAGVSYVMSRHLGLLERPNGSELATAPASQFPNIHRD